MDLFFYGILIGSLGVISFVIPVWASDLNGGIGVQGQNCNDVGYDAAQCKNIVRPLQLLLLMRLSTDD
jgi:hypothetical protein